MLLLKLMNRKTFLPVLGVLALAMWLAACSGSTESSATPEPKAGAEEEVAVVNAPATEEIIEEEAPEVIVEEEITPEPEAPQPAAAAAASAQVPVDTDTKKTVYAVGLDIWRTLEQLDLSAEEVEVIKRALSDAKAGKPAVDIDEWGPKVAGLARERSVRLMGREKQKSEAFLAKAAKAPGAEVTPSGLIYVETKAGTGESPKATDTVTVNYRGKLIDGTEFDSSYKRNTPASFPLNRVIPCWTEGVQKMKVGGKATLTCPSDIAYGDNGQPPRIPGGAALVFDVELLDIAKNDNAK